MATVDMAGKLEAAFAAWLGEEAPEGYEARAGFTGEDVPKLGLIVVCEGAESLAMGLNVYEADLNVIVTTDLHDGVTADNHRSAVDEVMELLEDPDDGKTAMNKPAGTDERTVKEITVSGWEVVGTKQMVEDPALRTVISLMVVSSWGD